MFIGEKKVRFLLCLIFILIGFVALSQTVDERQLRYARKYKFAAIEEMKKYKIPASITLAQGILESDCGTSVLATNTNNHFGIKCHKGWKGASYRHDDDAPQECFRKYNSVQDSYNDHSLFLTNRPWYKPLFKLKITDYKSWARGLKKAGYATNPKYATLLIKIIENNKLYNYDLVCLGKMTIEEAEAFYPLYVEVYNAEAHSDYVEEIGELKGHHDTQIESYDFEQDEKYLAYTELHDANIFKMCACNIMKEAKYINRREGRDIYMYNNVLFTLVKQDELIEDIADDLTMSTKYLRKFNDLPRGAKIVEDGVIYIENKNFRSHFEPYIVRGEGETIWTISQCFAVKARRLLKKNKIPRNKLNTRLKPGTIIEFY